MIVTGLIKTYVILKQASTYETQRKFFLFNFDNLSTASVFYVFVGSLMVHL